MAPVRTPKIEAFDRGGLALEMVLQVAEGPFGPLHGTCSALQSLLRCFHGMASSIEPLLAIAISHTAA